MYRALALALPVVLAAPALPQQSIDGIRSPAFAADGRLAIAVAGDIWILSPAGAGAWGSPRQLTSGGAWDRDPSWTPDGDIVFASDRAGTIDLWRVATAGGEPVRLTRSAEQDVEPSVGPDGAVVFARGIAGDMDLWLRRADGTEMRLTSAVGSEREPALSPDGKRIAYISAQEGRRELRVRAVDGNADTVLMSDRQARAPAWSPNGHRIAFGVEGRDAGIWIVDADGRYAHPAATAGAAPAWSPDGAWIVAAEADRADVGYNGDPDRLGERLAGDVFAARGGLRRFAAPPAPAAGEAIAVRIDERAPANASAYDRVWTRVARLYYGLGGEPGRLDSAGRDESAELREWRRIGVRHRAAAVAAGDDAALQEAIWRALRERPIGTGAVGRAGVSSAHELATAAGIEILELGGNVVDAAVAVSFALGVVEPDASGIGGYGEMLIQVEGLSEPVALEFMARAPEAATATNPAVDALPRSGPGVANVPGTVAGMELAWQKFGSGRVPWSRLIEPAIRLAENGYPISDGFATTLRRERAGFSAHASSRALFFPNGEPLAAGDTLRNPDLAWVLKEIAREGAAAFYGGEVGRRMVADLRAGGNLMTVEDLQRYFAAERRPVRTTYRGNDVFSGPPPVTGGAGLVAKLNLLERAPRGRNMLEDAATLHAMIEAWKLQPSTAGRIADPDLWPVDVTPFESKDTAATRWRCFDAERASVAGALTREDCGRWSVTAAVPHATPCCTTCSRVRHRAKNASPATRRAVRPAPLRTWLRMRAATL